MAGKLRGPVMVEPSRHSAADVGDEPLMLAAYVPVTVARDRVDGVALAKSQRASVILMDDGFQNPAIAKDAALIVIDSDRGIGNGYVFPGRSRCARRFRRNLARTDALIVVGAGDREQGHRRQNSGGAQQAGAVGAAEAGSGLRGERLPASASSPLPASATPGGSSGRFVPPASTSSANGVSTIITRSRKLTSTT